MAIMYPKRLTASNSTKGERTLFNLISTKLDDSVTAYYEPKINKVSPDLLLIGENLGVLILEIKDYTISNLHSANSKEWTFTTGQCTESPYSQARRYSFAVTSLLSKDPLLSTEKGKFKFNYAYGVVFTNITRLEFISSQLDTVYDMNLTLFKDDLEGVTSSDFFDLLYGLHSFTDKVSISQDLRDRIRYHLFPEVRIGEDGAKYNEANLTKFKSLKTMDAYQETLAREVGEGHRLIRGVAGSGKTIILVAKAKLLHDSNPDSKIVICCYSVTLVSYIKWLLGSYAKKIEVKTFHEFVMSNYQFYDIDNLESLNDMLESNIVSKKFYDHVLVDEGQDMDPSWIGFLYKSLSDDKGTFLLSMDSAQTIFRKSLLSSTGIDFRGRSTILTTNYRNPKVITDLAWKYYSHYISDSDDSEVVPPLPSMSRRGRVAVKKYGSYDEELANLIHILKHATNYGEIAIIYRVSRLKDDYLGKLFKRLDEEGIPYDWVTKDRKSKSQYKHENNSIKVLTVDSSKGLSFPTVFFITFTTVHPEALEELETEVKKSYIGMTRCVYQLCVSYHEDNILAEGLNLEGGAH